MQLLFRNMFKVQQDTFQQLFNKVVDIQFLQTNAKLELLVIT